MMWLNQMCDFKLMVFHDLNRPNFGIWPSLTPRTWCFMGGKNKMLNKRKMLHLVSLPTVQLSKPARVWTTPARQVMCASGVQRRQPTLGGFRRMMEPGEVCWVRETTGPFCSDWMVKHGRHVSLGLQPWNLMCSATFNRLHGKSTWDFSF